MLTINREHSPTRESVLEKIYRNRSPFTGRYVASRLTTDENAIARWLVDEGVLVDKYDDGPWKPYRHYYAFPIVYLSD